MIQLYIDIVDKIDNTNDTINIKALKRTITVGPPFCGKTYLQLILLNFLGLHKPNNK